MERFAILAVACCAVVYALHRPMLWMERKGWVYYWHKRGSGNVGNILIPVQAVFQPEVNYVIEERARKQAEAEQDDSGAPPFPEND